MVASVVVAVVRCMLYSILQVSASSSTHAVILLRKYGLL